MALIQSARTPTIALARALRRAGLAQGRGKDFRVEGQYRDGERVATYALLLTQHADETVAAHADDIERWTSEDGGWSFTVSVRYIDGKPRPHTTISNGAVERIREEPPTVTPEPAPEPEPEPTAGTAVLEDPAEPEKGEQPPAPPKASVTITHTRAEGTLLDGSRKGDGVYELVRPFGFRSFRSLGMLGIQRSRDREADRWRINRATAALRDAGYEVTVEIDETQRRSFAEAEAERLERAEDRAERFNDRADRAASNSNARHKAAMGALDGIEPGQPVLVGHHSERRHRRAIERSDNHMRKSIEESDKATHYGHRAEAAEQYEGRRYDPNRTRRRLEKLKADLRWHERARERSSNTGRHDRAIADLNEEIAHWESVVEKARQDGVKLWEADDFAPGDFALYYGTWYQVKRANPKTLSIAWDLRQTRQVLTLEDATETGTTYTFTLDYTKVKARCPDEAMRAFLADGKVPGTKLARAASEAQPASAVRAALAAKPKVKKRSDPKIPKRVKVVSEWDATEATLTYLDGRGKPHKLYEPVTISAPEGEKFTEAASSRSLLAAVTRHLEEHGFQYPDGRWTGGSRSGLIRSIEPVAAEGAPPASEPEAAPAPEPQPEAPAADEPPAGEPEPAPPVAEQEPAGPPADDPAPPVEDPAELRLQREQAAVLGWSAGQAEVVIAAAAGRLYRHVFGTLHCQDQPGTVGRAISNHRLNALTKAGFLTVGAPDATRRRPILVTVDGRRAVMVWKRWKPKPVEMNREQECERLRPLLHGEQARRLARQAQEAEAERKAANAEFHEVHQRLIAWEDRDDRLWRAWAKVNGIAYRLQRRPAGWVPTEEEIAEHRLDAEVVAELRADAENPEPKPVLPALNQRPTPDLPPMDADDQTPEQLDLFAIA
ncbi:hypothetical protein RVR_4463 [Actinacidiphila reveromycinica]|uniref:DUF3560 domain-containing protein n=1 Tax=Actinacidiphila reveromycinica TaxID=659352 RepID=A0A7U3UT87_9ACTN|nr:DUF3560 domain-containing protein [Streptomyces sp. SN-593]BBA98324.1 hypothetical protein RVR_4463 [Streptomyces sp. SN-593]